MRILLIDSAQYLHNPVGMNSGLEPAATVIAKCGGIDAAAKIVKRHRSVVNRWLSPKDVGGTGGLVPMRHAQVLLREVSGLSERDFFGDAEPAQAPSEAAE